MSKAKNETPEQREARLAKAREGARRRRDNETAEQREARLTRDREWGRRWREANPEKKTEARARTKQWQEDNSEKYRKRQREYYDADPQRTRDRIRRWKLLTHYGLTPEDRDRMEREQKGCCAICADICLELCVDHCHATKKVRKLLCRQCNAALGAFKDDPQRLRAAADYVEHHARLQEKT